MISKRSNWIHNRVGAWRVTIRRIVPIIIIAVAISVLMIRLYNLNRHSTLVGKYTSTSDKYKYLFTLKPDGTYSQRIIDPNGQEYTNAGNWEAGHSQGESVIKVEGFKFFWMGEYESAGLYVATVKRSMLGRTELWFADCLIFSYSSPLSQENESSE